MRNPIQKNSFSILIIFAALSIVGIFIIPSLRLQKNPSQTTQDIFISAGWSSSTSARVLEQEVITPLEGIMSTLNGLTKITSTTNKSYGNISLSFQKDVDIIKTRHEVSALIRQVYPKLPDGISYPTISMRGGQGSYSNPILTYFFNGPFDLNQLQSYADDHLKNKFSDIKDISEIRITGGTKTAYQLVYDQNQLNTLNIRKSDITNSINNFNRTSQIGLAYTNGGLSKQIYVQLDYGKLDKNFWDNIIITNYKGKMIRLTDLCKIERIEIPPSSYHRVNGLNTVNIYFYPEKGSNHLVLAKQIKERIAELSKQLPQKHSFLLASDTTVNISKELNKIIYRTLMTVIILLLFVFLISLSFRYLFVILISLSCNILLSFTLYAFFGVDIHIYSLAGITISLGLIIDNSIVMIDHIRNYRNKRVYLALLASTITTITSLIIVLFLPDNLKLNLIDFAKIIIINLSVSLLIALWFIPALLEKLPLKKVKGKTGNKRRKRIIRLSNIYLNIIRFFVRWKWAFIIMAVLGFGLPAFMLPEKLQEESYYKDLYNKTLGSDTYIQNIKPISDIILGGSFRLFSKFVFEGTNFKENEETKIRFSAQMEKGIPIHVMNNIFISLEGFLATFPEIKQFTSNIHSSQNGSIEITFKPEHEFTFFPYKLKAMLTQKLIDYGGMGGSVTGIGKGFGQSIGISESLDYRISIFGYNFDELGRQANILADKLSVHQRIRNLNTELNTSGRYYGELKDFEYILQADLYKTASYNRTVRDLSAYMNASSLSQNSSAHIMLNDRSENIYIKSRQSMESDKWLLMHSPIIDSVGLTIAEVGSITKKVTSPAINKFNQQYKKTIGYTFLGNRKLGDRIKKRAVEEMKRELPLGYTIETESYFGYWGRKKMQPYYLLLIIILGIFMISSILFESLKQPLAIISIIPLSYIGIFLSFYFSGLSFDQGGSASFILITGLVVNSAIYIINEYNNKKRAFIAAGKKINYLQIYLKAFNSKIIPVFLTITSSVLGLIPFMMMGKEEAFWYAFAAGSVGGLVFSFFVLLVYLPLFLLGKKSITKIINSF